MADTTRNARRGADEAPADAKAAEPAAAATQEHAQQVMDEGTKKGYIGEQPHEPNPRTAYSLEGGAPDVDVVNPVPRREPVDRTAAEQNPRA